jgi:hypothetical protein
MAKWCNWAAPAWSSVGPDLTGFFVGSEGLLAWRWR